MGKHYGGLIKIFGIINNVELLFLVDIIACHNLLSLQDANQLKLLVYTKSVGNILLANREQLYCTIYIQALGLFHER